MEGYNPLLANRIPRSVGAALRALQDECLMAWIVHIAQVDPCHGGIGTDERGTVSSKSYIKLATDLATIANPTRENVGYFFINNFLLSRIDSEMPSDLKEYDEDVNVYTASLLAGSSRDSKICCNPTTSPRAIPTYLRGCRERRTRGCATASTRRTRTSSMCRWASSAN